MEEVKQIHWWDVYKCENVNDAVQVFTKLVCEILDRDDMAPIKTFQQRRKYATWLSEETKLLMAERDEAVSCARRS